MKKIALLTLSLISVSLFGAGPQAPHQAAPGNGQIRKAGISWMTNFAQAAEEAKKSNKPMLLFFTGSDWCGWCKKLDSEVFATPEFASLAGSRFVFVDIDFPRNGQQPADIAKQNNALKQKYGVTGFPTIILLAPDQSFIAETGYRPGGGKAYADYLITLIQ